MTPVVLTHTRSASRFATAVLIVLLVPSAAVRAAPGGLLRGEAASAALAAAVNDPRPNPGGGDGNGGNNPAPAPDPGDGQNDNGQGRPPPFVTDHAEWEHALLTEPDLAFSPATNQLIYSCAGLSNDGGTYDSGTSTPTSIPAPSNMTLSPDAIPADASGLALPKEQDPLIADAFKLHSRPGAAKKIVLDFTGHTLRAGTYWGADANKNGDVPIVTPPYDLDNNPSILSAAERAAIVSIWRSVAEDYAAWDVDVTTEEPPGTDDEADASLVGVGTRVAIGKNNGWFDNAGGVAFVGGFAQNWSGPVAFVFNDNAASAAIAISHEVGHTLGLGHHGTVAKPDGTGASEYYKGHGAWAPVMGVGYGKNVIQWSKGDYAYASKPNQDDIATISGVLPAAPWFGGGRDVASAETVTLVTGAPANKSGIFLSGVESHFYTFNAAASGTLTIALSVNPRAPTAQGNSRTHLAAKVRLLRLADASVVGTHFNNVGPAGIDGNVPDTPAMSYTVPASGVYYIEIAATRNGDALTGYTEYGSSGTYALSVVSGPGLVGGVVPANLGCFGTTSVQLTSAAGNCNTGWAVRAADVYRTLDGRAATVSPAIGTAVAGGTSRIFTATLDANTCTTTVTVAACQAVSVPDSVTCRSPSYTLAAGQCGGLTVPLADLYVLAPGAGSTSSAPAGTATTTLPADGVLGPGVTRVDVRATAGGATCTSVVTITPCRPAVISTTATVYVDSAPGTCAGTPAPAAVVSAATLGRGALSINARTTTTGSVVPAPLKAGKYFVQVVYPGGVLSAVSAYAVPLGVNDVEAPFVGIKPAIVRDAAGFICAKGVYSTSTTACVSVSSTSSVLDQTDNCPVSSLVRQYQCAGTYCPTSLSPTATRLCISVASGAGRREVTFRVQVTDKGGRTAEVLIPIAAYHYRDVPAGTTCYTA